jgi:hypothetical protein
VRCIQATNSERLKKGMTCDSNGTNSHGSTTEPIPLGCHREPERYVRPREAVFE